MSATDKEGRKGSRLRAMVFLVWLSSFLLAASSALGECHERNPWASDQENYPSIPASDALLISTFGPINEAMGQLRNWKTGCAFTQDEIQRLRYLHLHLTDNTSLLALSDEGREGQLADLEEKQSIAYKMDTQEATCADVNAYFGYMQTWYTDRIAVIDFVLNETQAGEWDSETEGRYALMKTVAEAEKGRVEEQWLATINGYQNCAAVLCTIEDPTCGVGDPSSGGGGGAG